MSKKEESKNVNVETNEENIVDAVNVEEKDYFDAADIGVGDFVKAKWKKNKKKIVKGGALALGAAAGLFILKTLMTEDESCDQIAIDGNDDSNWNYKLEGPDGEVTGNTTFDEAPMKANTTYDVYETKNN